MKKLISSAVIATALLGTSLAASAKDTAEQTRDVPAFDAVKLKGSMDVNIVVGKAQSVKVEADSDIIDKLYTKVSGGKLEIGMERGSWHHIKVMKVTITVPSLKAAGLYGSGDLMVDGAKGDAFDLDLKGSGDVAFHNGQIGKFELDLAGSGDVDLDGTCDRIDVDLAGSGDIKATKFQCKEADVSVRGSGDVSVYASEKADVSIAGSGDVTVHGKPGHMNSRVRGSGDVMIR
ncbi:head GIN domain-containing protein [Kordiimonas marina]|uniref:head GIN domain-containing protein n=1 Tax=Kordiimonas marina TaxID=2872312 RepID=UPI001FF64A59|nr:head GIN domain-containing protein [Kordiimonas marina]MCJ9430499.1 DUF2807 domain-containing protein [Kordiimonas marina]